MKVIVNRGFEGSEVAGACDILQSPNANSILQTLLQASRYSTNKIDSTNSTTIPNASQSKLRKCR